MSYAIDMPSRQFVYAPRTAWPDGAVVIAFMAIRIASSAFGAAGPDTARDIAAALAIRELAALPLQGRCSRAPRTWVPCGSICWRCRWSFIAPG